MYVILLQQLREQSNVLQMSYIVARSNGAEVDPPRSYDEAITELDALLAAPLQGADDPNSELREALGLNGR